MLWPEEMVAFLFFGPVDSKKEDRSPKEDQVKDSKVEDLEKKLFSLQKQNTEMLSLLMEVRESIASDTGKNNVNGTIHHFMPPVPEKRKVEHGDKQRDDESVYCETTKNVADHQDKGKIAQSPSPCDDTS